MGRSPKRSAVFEPDCGRPAREESTVNRISPCAPSCRGETIESVLSLTHNLVDQPLPSWTSVPGCRSARSGLAAIFVTAIAAFNQSLSPKSSHAAIRLGCTHRLGRSVKARRFADREQGDFVVAAPGPGKRHTARRSQSPASFGSPYFPRSHGEQEDRLSCTPARAALPASRLGVPWRFLSELPLLLGQPEFHRRRPTAEFSSRWL